VPLFFAVDESEEEEDDDEWSFFGLPPPSLIGEYLAIIDACARALNGEPVTIE
jgi:hypothetical protein